VVVRSLANRIGGAPRLQRLPNDRLARRIDGHIRNALEFVAGASLPPSQQTETGCEITAGQWAQSQADLIRLDAEKVLLPIARLEADARDRR